MTTKLDDVIIPELFNPYVVQRSKELSALFSSGVITSDAEFDRLASGPAPIVQMPFFNDLTGDAEDIIEDEDLTPKKITSGKDQATIIRRASMWAATDLSAALAGKDPADAIAELVATWWSRQMQKELIASLTGVFGAASMAALTMDISGEAGAAAVWSPDAFLDANQLLGDAKSSLSAVAMHSATETLLRKQDLIEYVRPSEGGAPIGYYQGKRVIVDDGCPAANGVYTTYLFGQGAVAYGTGSPVGFVPTEVDRDKRKGSGVDYLINRRTFILHPRGIKWTNAERENIETPTRAELADALNWQREYEVKAIRVVEFKHKLV